MTETIMQADTELTSQSLNITQAADFLKIHPVTLSKKASSGEIQGAKIGKCWVFLKVDLIAHIRSQYKTRALIGELEGKQQCHSMIAKTPPFGGLKSPSVEKQYKEVLGLKTKS